MLLDPNEFLYAILLSLAVGVFLGMYIGARLMEKAYEDAMREIEGGNAQRRK